jgi:Protein kinase domain
VPAGSEAPLLYSVQYAPPEVIAAAARGKRTVVASGAVDVWALGVVAFELLTRSRVFPPFNDRRDDMVAKLLGRGKLPWEEEGAAKQVLPQLRALKRSVLACLARDPARRPDGLEVHGKWAGLLEEETATASAALTVTDDGRPAGGVAEGGAAGAEGASRGRAVVEAGASVEGSVHAPSAARPT